TVRVGSGEGAWALFHSLGRGWARHLSSGKVVTLWEREDPDDYEDYGMAARLVSIVGPHVTYEIMEGGYREGAAHPFAYHSYRVVRLRELTQLHPDSGRPGAVPLKWLFHDDNTRCGSVTSGDQATCDHGVAEERVLSLLKDDPFLKEARQQSMASCIFDEGDLVGTSYGFHRLHGDQVEVHLGLSHGCEVNRGMFNLVKVRMKPPPSPAPGVSPSRTSTLLQDLREADVRGLLGHHLRTSEGWPADPEMAPEPEVPPHSVVLSSRAPERITDDSSERCRELGICHPQRARGNHALCRGTHACRKWGYCQYVAMAHRTWRPMGQLKARERAGRLHRGYVDLRKADADLLEHHLLERGHGWMRDREGDRFIALSEWPSDTGLFGMCLPGGDDCAASDACERYGRCVGTAYACEWPADAEGRCDVPMGAEGINPCKTFGKCTNRSGRCYAMSDEDCAGSSVVADSGSDVCNIYGRCVAEKRACVAKRPADCAQSEGCKTDGLCCLDGWRGGCFACKPEQCQASEACEKEGRCGLERRRCAKETP
ncbi:MAG: hypothetical protein VYE15_04775, partial [Myxococcota bacterium]|nr:hypothetical protein [Myxococcota bacterium]